MQRPIEEIIKQIQERTSLPEDEIKAKIDAKLKQLTGLISREGAAHIVANELGIRLFNQISGRLQIKNILSGMRDVETVGRVVRVYEQKQFQSGERTGQIASFLLGDDTGVIRVVLWNEQAANAANLAPGMIVKVKGAYVRERGQFKELHINDKSKLILNPEGEFIADIKIPTTSRKKIGELAENDVDVEILGTVVQVFELKFFETCPKCQRRARPSDGGFSCTDHGIVQPSYSYVLNLFIDDGSENMRAVFFRNQALRLVNKKEDELLAYRTSPEAFDNVRTELLGSTVKLSGRVVKNEMFGRLEFIAQNVYLNPALDDEIAKAQYELSSAKGEALPPEEAEEKPVEDVESADE